MPTENSPPRSEREQTDESLRVEREKVDRALGEDLSADDERADAVINRARARADDLLAAARANTDRQAKNAKPATHAPETIRKDRAREDQRLEDERADADETLQQERTEQVALLVTEREETDKDLLSERARSDDSLAMRDEFLGIVSHDLRDLLGAIIGLASLIAAEVESENHKDLVVKHAQRIQRSGHRMNRLIGDLIDVASIEAGSLAVTREVTDPALVVTEAVDTFQAQASSSGLSLKAEIVPAIPLASFDPARILQVLTNLLSNALKFTPASGQVIVHVERIRDDIQFSVSDTGVGIPVNQLESVFERFVQVSKGDRRGVGLGLYISRCIVEGHGGRIWAKSEEGKGSTFFFTLPMNVEA